jgi:outer membrane lipoprotein SlyB
MNSDKQFLDDSTEYIEPIPVQADIQPEHSSENQGVSILAAGVAGAAIGSVIGGRIAGKTGAVLGAVAGAVAGSLTAQATPDDPGKKLKNVTENVADKVKEAAERT